MEGLGHIAVTVLSTPDCALALTTVLCAGNRSKFLLQPTSHSFRIKRLEKHGDSEEIVAVRLTKKECNHPIELVGLQPGPKCLSQCTGCRPTDWLRGQLPKSLANGGYRLGIAPAAKRLRGNHTHTIPLGRKGAFEPCSALGVGTARAHRSKRGGQRGDINGHDGPNV